MFALAPRGRGFGAAREFAFKGPSSGASIALDPRDGAVVVAYGTPLDVAQLANQQAAVRILATASTAFSEQTMLSDPAGLSEASAVVAAGSGAIGVTYTRSGNTREMYLVRRSATGAWAPREPIPGPASGDGRFAVDPIATLPTDGSALVSWSLDDDTAGFGAVSKQTVASLALPGAAFGAPVALTPAGDTYGTRAIASAGADSFLAAATAHGPLLLATRPAGGGALRTRTVTSDGDGDAVLATAGSHVLLAYQQGDRLRLHIVR
jgi:hypothetical protein